MLKTLLSLVLLASISCVSLIAQEKNSEEKSSNDSTKQNSLSQNMPKWVQKFGINGYGVVNYYNYDWQTLPDKRNAIDPERMNLYLKYNFTDKIEFKSEIEFEHGGTGSTMAFDPLEEFGEFEKEIEYGGSVTLEQVNLLFKLHKAFNVRVGKMRIYMGNASKQDKPKSYFTAYRSEVENTILPLGWYETGIEISGDIALKKDKAYPYFSYKFYVMSGLDNTGFSSLNWIRRGYQTRFETINANALAYALRFDYIFAENSEIGFNFYACNASPNRPKNDFKTDSWVSYGDLHFAWDKHPFRVRAFAMMGFVQNSEALSTANRNLSNNLDVKRTPVGKAAAGAYVEAAYDFLPLITKKTKQELYVFGRLEWYDSMWKVQGRVFDNPRYERTVYTVGVNYFPIQNIVFKAHYAWRTLGSKEHENTFAMGMGFSF